jgi:hypothetical protein
MNEARKIFLELKLEMLKLIFVQGMFNSLLLFIGEYIVLSFFLSHRFSLIYSILCSLIFLVIYCVYELKKVNYETIEEKEPQLRDILRTVYDNMEEKSMMVRALVEDLTSRMADVQPANFFSASRAFVKITVLLVFLIAFPLLSSYQVLFHEWGEYIGEVTQYLPSFKDDAPSQKEFEDVVFSPTDEIYGDPSVAILGDEELTLTLATSLGNIDFNKPTEASSRKFADQESLNEVYASSDASYEETISRSKQQIVKEYFKQLEQKA